MSTHSAWTGHISLSLLSIPVKLYVAARGEKISMNNLHQPCKSRLKQPKICPVCAEAQALKVAVAITALKEAKGKAALEKAIETLSIELSKPRELLAEEIVKGFEFSKGQYVLVTEAEMESVAPVSNHIMSIEQTCKASEIDAMFLSDSYFVVPEPAGAKAYALLAQGLKECGMVALAPLSRSQREMVMLLRPFGKGIVAQAMFYAPEVRAVAEFEVLKDVAISPGELELANKLLTKMKSPFDPERYADGYHARLVDLLEKKQKGETINVATPTAPSAAPVDLLAALQASIDAAPAHVQ